MAQSLLGPRLVDVLVFALLLNMGRVTNLAVMKQLSIPLEPDVLDALEEWCNEQTPPFSQADAIQFLLRDTLIGLGLLDLPPPPEKAH